MRIRTDWVQVALGWSALGLAAYVIGLMARIAYSLVF